MKYPKEAAVYKVLSSQIANLVAPGEIIEGVVVYGGGEETFLGFESRLGEAPAEVDQTDNGSKSFGERYRWYMVGPTTTLVELEPLTKHAADLLAMARGL